VTTILITLGDLQRVKTELEDVVEDYLAMARELGAVRNGLPKMAPSDRERLAARLDEAIRSLTRLAFRYAQDAGALGVTITLAEDDDARRWVGGRDLLTLLATGYRLTGDVFRYAASRGITIAEAADELGGGKALQGIATMLGPEGSVDKVLLKLGYVKAADIALEFIEQWSSGEGNWWDAFQRTAVSTGVSTGLAAGMGRTFCSRLPHLLAKGGCMVIAAAAGGYAGDEAVKLLFGHSGYTEEEREIIRASRTPSGLTPAEERRRAGEAREGLMTARSDMVDELVAGGMDRDEAQRIAELNFPDYIDVTF